MTKPDEGVREPAVYVEVLNRDHITIHAYKAVEYVRAITLGMKKFGLPDIVVDEFSWSLNNQMGNTIDLFAQSLIEGATPAHGAYDFDVSKIQHAGLREVYERNLLDGSHPVALLTLADAAADEGDPDNRLLELRFDRYAGKTVHERQQKFAGTFYGSVDTATRVKHNEAILAASERARKRLPALREAFNVGLEPGERILLKAPFQTPKGGQEWMWVEVVSWKGDDIRGLLDNEPDWIPALHAGATVKISEHDVFDYLRTGPVALRRATRRARKSRKRGSECKQQLLSRAFSAPAMRPTSRNTRASSAATWKSMARRSFGGSA